MTYHHQNKMLEEIDILLGCYNIEVTLSQKIHLYAIIKQTIVFNKNLSWDDRLISVSIATTPKDLIDIFRLRSKIYAEMGYSREFPDTIKGLNFDEYDMHSAILFTTYDTQISGTCRVIFDSSKKLPMDKNFSLESLRKKEKSLAELSRLMINHHTNGLAQEFKWLTLGAYFVMKLNTMSTLVSVIIQEHFKLYQRFGGFSIEQKVDTYGSLDKPFLITSWEIDNISKYFQKVFLSRIN